MVRNAKISQNGFIVMGNRPIWKILKVVRNAKISQNGFNVMCKDFSKWFQCNGQPAQMEDEKSFQRGLIVMSDLPR
jgi:hypothetical protein